MRRVNYNVSESSSPSKDDSLSTSDTYSDDSQLFDRSEMFKEKEPRSRVKLVGIFKSTPIRASVKTSY